MHPKLETQGPSLVLQPICMLEMDLWGRGALFFAQSQEWFDSCQCYLMRAFSTVPLQCFDKFAEVIRAASNNGMSTGKWDEPNGRLARVILFDQLTRNAFRKQPEAFHYDDEALAISRRSSLPPSSTHPLWQLV